MAFLSDILGNSNNPSSTEWKDPVLNREVAIAVLEEIQYVPESQRASLVQKIMQETPVRWNDGRPSVLPQGIAPAVLDSIKHLPESDRTLVLKNLLDRTVSDGRYDPTILAKAMKDVLPHLNLSKDLMLALVDELLIRSRGNL